MYEDVVRRLRKIIKAHKEIYASRCRDFIPKPITNADRIRAMSDEELAAFMFNANGCPMWVSDYSCKEDNGCHGAKGACWLDWLKQDVLRGYDIGGGGIRYDEEGNVIDYGITGPPGESGVKREATE